LGFLQHACDLAFAHSLRLQFQSSRLALSI
jgi:hypothetical protein